jgi:hypothetical protein
MKHGGHRPAATPYPLPFVLSKWNSFFPDVLVPDLRVGADVFGQQ